MFSFCSKNNKQKKQLNRLVLLAVLENPLQFPVVKDLGDLSCVAYRAAARTRVKARG
jgi:hypothetical protein